ncbi:MAG: 3-hydroxybutyryl-CoA dehydrogenase [Syntrophomonadaceae bacterium]|nr:3-hydroxybutyryl-CoA dehydrogenase [Syntrophomonadaceae bacterium]
MKKIGVIGSGTMGLGIAQVCAESGFDVVLNDIDIKFVEKAVARIEKSLSRAVEKGKIDAGQKDATLGRIQKSADLKDMADADIVIEAIFENMEAKKQVYATLDEVCKPETIFASNTSSLSVTEIAANTKRPAKFIGMHFFNPATIMKLVEVVMPMQVAEETILAVEELARQLGKETVRAKDSPGFIVNRILVMGGNEVPFMVEEGVATPEDIDKAMKLGANWRMGPCELGDLVGVDIQLAVRETLFKEFKDPKYRPSLLTYKMIRAGYLGQKTGKGWYVYDEKGNKLGWNKDLFR